MTNVARIVGKIVSFLPKTEGATGRIHLTGKQLELMAKAGGPEGDVLLKILSKNPEISSLDLAYKAKSNYSIGAFKVMKGKTPYMTGAVSVTEPGTTRSVVKARYSVGEKGKISQGNGFIDGGKPADAKDLAVSVSRRGGTLEGNISSGKAFAAHVKTNESALVDELKTLNRKADLEGYSLTTNKLQQKLDQAMVDARKILKGEGSSKAGAFGKESIDIPDPKLTEYEKMLTKKLKDVESKMPKMDMPDYFSKKIANAASAKPEKVENVIPATKGKVKTRNDALKRIREKYRAETTSKNTKKE